MSHVGEVSIEVVIAEVKRQFGEDQFALLMQRTHIAALQAALDAKAKQEASASAPS